MYRIFKEFEIGYYDNEEVELPDGRIAVVKQGEKHVVKTVFGTSFTSTEIRKILKDEGIELSRGVEVFAEETGVMHKYEMSDEDFIKYATLL